MTHTFYLQIKRYNNLDQKDDILLTLETKLQVPRMIAGLWQYDIAISWRIEHAMQHVMAYNQMGTNPWNVSIGVLIISKALRD